MIKITKVSERNKKEAESFAKREWLKHDKEHKYVYKEKKFEFVAYNGKEIIGRIRGNTNGGVAYLDNIIVNKKYRNKGVGKMLLNKFEEIARKNNCHACLLTTTNENHPEAIQFYEKNKYLIEAKINDLYWHIPKCYRVKRLK